MTVDTLEYVKRLEAAGVPRAQAHAVALRDEISAHLLTNADLGAAVDRVENKIESEVGKIRIEISRLDNKIETEIGKIRIEIAKLDNKFDANTVRVENAMWKVGFAVLGGGLAIGGLLLRFMR